MNLKQPVLGIAASILVIAIALLFVSLWTFPVFSGWVAYCTVCIVPMEIVIGVIWACKHPHFAASKPQPLKAILLAVVLVVVATIFGAVYFYVVGGGISPPVPQLAQCNIVCVAVTFFLAIPWGGWPFTHMTKNRVAAGIAMLAGAYIINYILFRIFYNYTFLKGAPIYVASLDPQGMFPGWNALVFYMSALFIMFLMLHFDLWPLTKFPSVMHQPILGIVWTSICILLGWLAYYIAVNVEGMDVVSYMVTGPVPFIFGTIIVLNMMQNSIFGKLEQPVKGLANAALAAVLGTLLRMMYMALMPTITGPLASGPPPYEAEIWLASALLGVTFPFMVFFAEFVQFWPLKRSETAP